jgi:hypothetical protein
MNGNTHLPPRDDASTKILDVMAIDRMSLHWKFIDNDSLLRRVIAGMIPFNTIR